MSEYKSAIIAYSGHAFVVAEAAQLAGLSLKYYTDLKEKEHNPFHLIYKGDESNEKAPIWQEDCHFILGIGNNSVRKKCGELILQKGKKLLNVIHPSTEISAMTEQGVGNFFARNSCVNPLVKIGNFCILNTGSVVEHECVIGDAVHIAPGAVLAGNVTIGEGTFVGANAVIKQGITVGKNVTIGAGAVVIKDIADNKIIVGNPGKEI